MIMPKTDTKLMSLQFSGPNHSFFCTIVGLVSFEASFMLSGSEES